MNVRMGMACAVLALAVAGGPVLAPLALAAPKDAATATRKQAAGKQGGKEVTDITADNMEVFDEKNLIVFSGNVRAKKGETRLTADRLEVFTAREKDADGKETTRMRRWVAIGNVRIVKGDTIITGARADMDVKRDVVTVTGNVVVRQPDSTIRGSKLVSNLRTNVTRVIAGGKGRVRGIFR